LTQLWESGANWGLFFLRLALGLIFVTHGYPKMTGVESGTKASREGLTDSIRRLGLPFPRHLAIVIGTIQVFGGLMLLLGLGTRLAAALLAVIMLVASTRNFVEKQFVGSADFPFSLLASLIALGLLGGGAFGLETFLY
jgi:putative oxidoreductase